MKFRTFLMFVCMISVPMIAMFSHKIPTEMRTACGELLIAPITYFSEIIFQPSVASPTSQETAAFEIAPNVPLLAHQDSHHDRADVPNTLTESSSSQHPQHLPAAEPPISSFRDQLIATGVRRLIVEPATDRRDWYHGSCRIAVDTQGELQRLFHAHASTESATFEKLLKQVHHWQQQVPAHVTAKSPETLLYK